MHKVMLCKEKAGVSGVHTFRKLSQTNYTLSCARFTGLGNRRAEWCKPFGDQSVVIQTTDPNRSALWCFIWILFRWVPCSWEDKGAGPGVKRLSSGFWNATGRATRKSRTPPRNRYRPQSGARCHLTASSIQTAGGATMGWWIGGTSG